MTTSFFPETSHDDVIKSILILIGLICSALIPAILGIGGLFTRTPIGILFLALFLFGAFMTYARFPYKTKDNISQMIVMPIRVLLILFTALGVAWIAGNTLNLDPTASRIGIVLFSSLVELVSIFNLTMYGVILIIYLLKRHSQQS